MRLVILAALLLTAVQGNAADDLAPLSLEGKKLLESYPGWPAFMHKLVDPRPQEGAQDFSGWQVLPGERFDEEILASRRLVRSSYAWDLTTMVRDRANWPEKDAENRTVSGRLQRLIGQAHGMPDSEYTGLLLQLRDYPNEKVRGQVVLALIDDGRGQEAQAFLDHALAHPLRPGGGHDYFDILVGMVQRGETKYLRDMVALTIDSRERLDSEREVLQRLTQLRFQDRSDWRLWWNQLQLGVKRDDALRLDAQRSELRQKLLAFPAYRRLTANDPQFEKDLFSTTEGGFERFYSLTKSDPKGFEPVLRAILLSGDRHLSWAALHLLWFQGFKLCPQDFPEEMTQDLVYKTDVTYRPRTLEGLAGLRAMVEHPDAKKLNVAAHALELLEEFGDPEAKDLALKLSQSSSPDLLYDVYGVLVAEGQFDDAKRVFDFMKATAPNYVLLPLPDPALYKHRPICR